MMKATNPIVSVVVPLYNKEKWVARCLSSVLQQSFQDFELIVVNDGSTDGSASVVRTFRDDRMRLIEKANGGVASARNAGIDAAKGTYIAFLDADDEWQPDHLRILVEALSTYPDAVVVCDEYRGQGWSYADVLGPAMMGPLQAAGQAVDCHRFNYLDQLTAGIFVTSCSSTALKKETLRKYRVQFNEGMKRGEDLNFWILLSRHGDFIYCDFDGARYHRQDSASEMNRSRDNSEPTPDFFSGMHQSDFNAAQLKRIRRFLGREYLKTAYQNRGTPFTTTEMKKGTLGNRHVVVDAAYLAIRFAPRLALDAVKFLRPSGPTSSADLAR